MLSSRESNLIRKYAETNLNLTTRVHLWEDTQRSEDLIGIRHTLVLEAYVCAHIYISSASISCVILAFFTTLMSDFNSLA